MHILKNANATFGGIFKHYESKLLYNLKPKPKVKNVNKRIC